MTKTNWIVDTSHSAVEFSIRHMMISNVRGTFNEFEAVVVADPTDLTDATIEFTIDASSIDTRKKDRDDHLRSADFFDVENHPQIIFKAIDIQKKSDNNYDVTGDFTMHGVSKQVTFDITSEGQITSPDGSKMAGFSGQTEISRAAFGLTWNSTLETGGVLVSDQVKINLDLQFHQQA